MTHDDAQIRRDCMVLLVGLGVPVATVARAFGVKVNTVYVAMRQSGVPTPGSGRPRKECAV